MATQAKPLTRADFIGFGEIAKARQRTMTTMFMGTQLKFGRTGALSTAKDILTDSKNIATNAKKLNAAAQTAAKTGSKITSLPIVRSQIEAFLTQCADVSSIQDIADALGSAVVADLIAEATPILGVVTSSVKLAKATKDVALDGYNLYGSANQIKGFLRGDPQAAAIAVQAIIKRDLARHSIDAARHAAATGTKIAGLFADFGTATTAAIGMANATASLGLKLFALGLDIKDMRAGNKHLSSPMNINLSVFEDCPILGCYLITCANTSDVANMFVADIGLPGWMDKVEALKRNQMDPLLKVATAAIAASSLQLEGLASNKGTHAEKTFFSTVRGSLMKSLNLG